MKWCINKPWHLHGRWKMGGVLKRRLLGAQCGVQGQKIHTDYVRWIWQNKWDSQGPSEIKWYFSIMLQCCCLMVHMLTISLILNLWIFEACTFWNNNSLTWWTNTSVIFQCRVASACDLFQYDMAKSDFWKICYPKLYQNFLFIISSSIGGSVNDPWQM